MKLVFVVFLAAYSSLIAQDYTQYKLVDQMQMPIAGALIKSVNNNSWTYSSFEGMFYFLSKDLVSIEAMGFEKKQIILEDSIIQLVTKELIALETEVNANDYISVELGEEKSEKELKNKGVISKSIFYNPVVKQFSNVELARYIPNQDQKNGYLESVSIFIYKKLQDTIVLHLYEHLDSVPGPPISNYVFILPQKKGGWVDIDLKKYNIQLPSNGFWIGLEVPSSLTAYPIWYNAKDTTIKDQRWHENMSDDGTQINSYSKIFKWEGIMVYRANNDPKLFKFRDRKGSSWVHFYTSLDNVNAIPLKTKVLWRK